MRCSMRGQARRNWPRCSTTAKRGHAPRGGWRLLPMVSTAHPGGVRGWGGGTAIGGSAAWSASLPSLRLGCLCVYERGAEPQR
jgi:hypothetical protein